MKLLKLSLILICFFVSFSGMAQQYQLDSVVHSVNGTQFIAFQKYDVTSRRGELVRHIRLTKTDSIQKMERTQVVYDTIGNELYNVFSVWDPISSMWVDEEKTEQEFNSDHTLIRISNYKKKDEYWIKVFENKRFYTQDSIIEIDYDTKDNIFQPTQKSISIINTFDKVKTYVIFLWNDRSQNWQPLSRTDNIYQKDTTMVSTEALEWHVNKWKKQEKVVFELDKDHLPTDNYTIYKGHKNHWIAVNKFEEKLISEQNKKISNIYKWTDNEWVLQTQVETYFNKERKKQDVLFSEMDTVADQLKLQLEQMYFYDNEGRLILSQDFSQLHKKRIGIQNSILFDREGSVIQETGYEFDAENDTWNEKMITEFVYDKNIDVSKTIEADKELDLFNLNLYDYTTNKYALKQVRIYNYVNGEKVLSEVFAYFYSKMKCKHPFYR